MKNEYVLRERDDDEIARLKFQHQVWQKETHIAIEKANIQKGETIIDLGCGPGYLSYDLSRLVGKQGKVWALDNSEKFIRFIKSQNIANIEARKTDIRTELATLLPSRKVDHIFCRWVLMFTAKVEEIIGHCYDLLTEGGKFISIEYFRFQQIDMFPQSPHFDKIYQSVYQLLSDYGGQPDIGGQVHQIMRAKGFRKIELIPIYRTGKVKSPLWEWLGKNNTNHKNLVTAGLMTEEELQAYKEDWKERSRSDLSFVTAPPLMITIGEK